MYLHTCTCIYVYTYACTWKCRRVYAYRSRNMCTCREYMCSLHHACTTALSALVSYTIGTRLPRFTSDYGHYSPPARSRGSIGAIRGGGTSIRVGCMFVESHQWDESDHQGYAQTTNKEAHSIGMYEVANLNTQNPLRLWALNAHDTLSPPCVCIRAYIRMQSFLLTAVTESRQWLRPIRWQSNARTLQP